MDWADIYGLLQEGYTFTLYPNFGNPLYYFPIDNAYYAPIATDNTVNFGTKLFGSSMIAFLNSISLNQSI